MAECQRVNYTVSKTNYKVSKGQLSVGQLCVSQLQSPPFQNHQTLSTYKVAVQDGGDAAQALYQLRHGKVTVQAAQQLRLDALRRRTKVQVRCEAAAQAGVRVRHAGGLVETSGWMDGWMDGWRRCECCRLFVRCCCALCGGVRSIAGAPSSRQPAEQPAELVG